MPSRSSATVLVVERDPSVVRLLREILSRAGFTVLSARSAERALRLYELQRTGIGLLLIDGLPSEVEQIVRKHPELKVLCLSGLAGAEWDGDMPVLYKPFTPAALLQAIRSLLGERAAGA
jgi:DNA-binding response OmpR family regulator